MKKSIHTFVFALCCIVFLAAAAATSRSETVNFDMISKDLGGILPPGELFVSDGFVYGYSGTALQILQKSGATYARLCSIDFPSDVKSVFVEGSRLYAGTNSNGIYIFDLTNKYDPSFLGKSPDISGYEVVSVFAKGDYAYMGLSGRMLIFNISNPANIELVSVDSTFTPLKFIASGNTMYILMSASKVGIMDISNPAAPVRLCTDYAIGAVGNDFALVNNHLFVGTFLKGLQIINVANPAAPAKVGAIDTTKIVKFIRAQGNNIFVLTYSVGSGAPPPVLTCYDAANPADAIKRDTINFTGFSISFLRGMAVDAGNLLVSTIAPPELILVFDVSDPNNILKEQSYIAPGAVSSIARCGDSYWFSAGETLWKISKDDIMQGRAYYQMLEGFSCLAGSPIVGIEQFICVVRKSGDAVYFESINTGLETPQVLGSLQLAASGLTINSIIMKDNYVYIYGNLANKPTLIIVNVANPAQMSISSQTELISVVNYLQGMAISSGGDYLYLAYTNGTADKGIRVVNISNPQSPAVSSIFQTRGQIERVHYFKNRVFAISYSQLEHATFVQAINAQNAASLVEESYLQLSGDANLFAFDGEYILCGRQNQITFYNYVTPQKKVKNIVPDDYFNTVGTLAIGSEMNYPLTGSLIYSIPEEGKNGLFVEEGYYERTYKATRSIKYYELVKVPNGYVTLKVSATPDAAINDLAGVSPGGISRYQLNSTAALNANDGLSWKFKRWTGDATGNTKNTSLTMDRNKVAIAEFEKASSKPVLTLGSTALAAGYCGTYAAKNQVKIMELSLAADLTDDWNVQSVSFLADGKSKYVRAAVIKLFDEELGRVDYNGLMTLPVNKLVHKGNTLHLTVYFEFDSASAMCPIEEVIDYQLTTSVSMLVATPVLYQSFEILPPGDFLSGKKYIYCTENVTKQLRYPTIGAALGNNLGENDVVEVCAGSYITDDLSINEKGVTLKSKEGAELTRIAGTLTIRKPSVLIEGLTYMKIGNIPAGITLTCEGDILIKDCRFLSCDYSIYVLKNSFNGLAVRNCYFFKVGNGIFSFSNDSKNIEVSNCTFENLSNPVYISTCEGLNVKDNKFSICRYTTAMINIIQSKDIHILNNTMDAPYKDDDHLNTDGISVYDSYNIFISNNSLTGFDEGDDGTYRLYHAIKLMRCHSIFIDFNKILTSSYGMTIEKSRFGSIIKNTIHNSRFHCFELIGNHDIHFIENDISSNFRDVQVGKKIRMAFPDSEVPAGLFALNSSGTISKNRFTRDSIAGAIVAGESNMVFRSNIFENNLGFALLNETVNPLDARANYWNSPTGPVTEGISGDKVGPNIDFSNYLTARPFALCATIADTIFVPENKADSCPLYFVSWNPAADCEVSISEEYHAIKSEKSFVLPALDSIGARSMLKFSTPLANTDSAMNKVLMVSRSNSVEDTARFVIAAYTPILSEILILPDTVWLEPNQVYKFSAIGLDQYGNEIAITHSLWGCSAGSIESDGTFTAPAEPCTLEVRLVESRSGFGDTVVVVVRSQTPAEEPVTGANGIICTVEPNPISASSIIRIRSTEDESPKLEIYSLTGAKLLTLVPERNSATEYIARIPASGLVNGTYYFVVRQGTSSRTGKFIKVD